MLVQNGPVSANSSRAGLPGRCRSAFTLVELLVVIGIIALLVSILLPALGKARAQANAVRCSANLKEIGNAVLIYRTMNKGFGANLQNEARWLDPTTPTGLIDPNDANAYWGVLYASVSKLPKALFNCPTAAESLFPGASVRYDGRFMEGHIYTSYSLNAYGVNYHSTTTGASAAAKDARRRLEFGVVDEVAMFRRVGAGSSAVWLGRNLARMKGTSVLIMAHDGYETTVDGDGDTLNEFIAYSYPGSPYNDTDGKTDRRREYLRHNMKSNVLFADGHVAPLTKKEMQNTQHYTGKWDIKPAPIYTP